MMDTQTGKIIELSGEALQDAQARWRAWQAGLFTRRPRLVPADKDRVPASKRKRRKRTKARRSYRDYCR